MVAMPDPATFAILPWRPRERGVARMFCDIQHPDGTPFEGDPRFVLKRQLKRAADLGYTFYVGPELEYFYFKSSEAAGRARQGRLFRPDAARRRERSAPPDDHDARGDGHRRRVQPPRGRAEPARDRPPLYRRADDGRQRHDLPPRREGGGACERRLRHVHAKAAGRRERLRHAHLPVVIQGRPERLLQRRRRVQPLADRQVVHGRPAAARAGVHARHEPVGEQLQAPRAGLRSAGLPDVGAAQPLAT